MAYDPSLGKQVKNFRLNFFLREAQEKIKQKILKSPRTSTPGERKGFTKQSLKRSHLGETHMVIFGNQFGGLEPSKNREKMCLRISR